MSPAVRLHDAAVREQGGVRQCRRQVRGHGRTNHRAPRSPSMCARWVHVTGTRGRLEWSAAARRRFDLGQFEGKQRGNGPKTGNKSAVYLMHSQWKGSQNPLQIFKCRDVKLLTALIPNLKRYSWRKKGLNSNQSEICTVLSRHSKRLTPF